MATLGATLLNTADIAKRIDPDGSAAVIAEVLTESKPVLDHMPMFPSNMTHGHRSSIRTGLPTTTLRRINQGVASSKSTVTQIEDSITMLETQSTIDTKLLELEGNALEIRRREWPAFMESMGQEATRLIFNGSDATDEREFNGLYARSAYTALSSDQTLTAGDTGSDLSSIWLVVWGRDTIFGVYPKNIPQGGIQHKDKGEQLIQDDADETAIGGSKLFAYVDQFTFDFGLVVKDERYAVRICNFEVSDVYNIAGTQELTDYTSNIVSLMARAMHRVPNLRVGKACWYMARSVFEGLHVQSQARTMGALTTGADTSHTGAGKGGDDGTKGGPVMSFEGVPIFALDELGYAEAAVT